MNRNILLVGSSIAVLGIYWFMALGNIFTFSWYQGFTFPAIVVGGIIITLLVFLPQLRSTPLAKYLKLSDILIVLIVLLLLSIASWLLYLLFL